jgi:membrane protease YdiL (CAAX protease family)
MFLFDASRRLAFTMNETASIPVFGARRALGVFLAYIGVQLALGLGVGIVAGLAHGASLGRARLPPEALGNVLLWGAFVGLVGAGAASVWIAWSFAGRSTAGLREIGWIGATAREKAIGAALGVACALVFLVAFSALPPPPDFRPGPMRSAVEHGGRVAVWAWTLLAVAVAPPVEEFVFRGVLWTGLRASWGPAAAALTVTTLFVMLHLVETWRYPPALVAIGAMGLLALLVRVRFGSLVPAICLHAAYNGVLASLSFAGPAAR